MVLAKELRQAVLRAAMQGLLTHRLNTDSSVDDLLIDIKNKKNDMIANHIIGKEKPFSTLTKFDEQPYEIPDNWRYERFGTIIINRDAERIPLSASSRASKEKKYDYYGASGVIDKTDSFLFDKELLLIGEDGANLLSRSTPIAFIANGKYWVNNHAHVLDVCCGLNLQYICYYINSIDLSIYVTGTAQPKMNQSNMNAIWVPVPPIEEQQRIVDKINEIMPKIDEYEKIEKELEALEKEFPTNMKDALLQAAMQGKLTEQFESDSGVDELLVAIKEEKKELIAQKIIKKEKPLSDIEEEEIPFDIPENWRWVRWGNLAYSIQYGYNAPAQESGKIKMVRISDIQDNLVNWDSVPYCDISDEEIETYLLKENDILFARTGGTVGKSFLVSYVPEDAIYAGYLIRTRYNAKLIPQYLKFFMESQLYWVQLQNGKTQGCQPNCNGQTLSKMIIPLPPIEEQQRIVERLDALLPLCEDLREV